MRRANSFVTHELRERGGEPCRGTIGSEQLGNQGPSEQQIDEIDLTHLQNPVEECLGQRVQTVADDHRQARQSQFESHRSGGGERGAASREGIVFFVRLPHDDRISRPGPDRRCDRRRDCRDGRHNDAEGPDQVFQPLQRRAEDRQQTPDLAAAAAGQHGDQQVVGGETVRRPEASAISVFGAAFEYWMTDKGAG